MTRFNLARMRYPALDGAVVGAKAAIVLAVLGGIVVMLTHCGGKERQPTASWSEGLGVSIHAVASACVPDTLVGCGLGSTDEGITCATGGPPSGDCGSGSVEGDMGDVEVVAYCCEGRP